MKRKVTEVLRITIYIWMCIQIILGILWMVCNLGNFTDFQESRELLTMSTTLIVDEYTGYLYPFVIHLLGLLAEILKIPTHSLVYLLQVLLAYFAYQLFLQRVVFYKPWKKGVLRKRVPIYTLFVITLPPVMQVHMSLLTYSLASSVFVILLTKVIEACESEKNLISKDAISIALLWILSSQICVDYAWLSGTCVVVGACFYMGTHKRLCWKYGLIVLSAVICIAGLNVTLQTPGSMGKIQKSPEGVLLTRVVWPKFTELSHFWSEEVKEQWSIVDLMMISTYPEKVIYEFGPTLDHKLGYEGANQIYRNMIKQTLAMDTKYVLGGILEDGCAYLCPPLTMYLNINGVGNSYAGWNYGRMKDYTPRLAYYYVNVSLSGWIYLLITSAILVLIHLFPKQWMAEAERKRNVRLILLCVILSLGINLWYVMTSGHMQDYKKVLVISVLWAFGMIGVLNRTEEKYYMR